LLCGEAKPCNFGDDPECGVTTCTEDNCKIDETYKCGTCEECDPPSCEGCEDLECGDICEECEEEYKCEDDDCEKCNPIVIPNLCPICEEEEDDCTCTVLGEDNIVTDIEGEVTVKTNIGDGTELKDKNGNTVTVSNPANLKVGVTQVAAPTSDAKGFISKVLGFLKK